MLAGTVRLPRLGPRARGISLPVRPPGLAAKPKRPVRRARHGCIRATCRLSYPMVCTNGPSPPHSNQIDLDSIPTPPRTLQPAGQPWHTHSPVAPWHPQTSSRRLTEPKHAWPPGLFSWRKISRIIALPGMGALGNCCKIPQNQGKERTTPDRQGSRRQRHTVG